MNKNANQIEYERVIGLDSHPDTFTAAIVQGRTPAEAVVQKTFNKVPMHRLQSWASKQTSEKDLIVLEASGNSFQVVRTLAAIKRQALVLESGHLGRLKEAHANNDRISAVRIAKAYLAGTAKKVWVPDQLTQERRDWYQAYRKNTKRTTQLRNRTKSYLSDNGVRLKKGTSLTKAKEVAEQLQKLKQWTPGQWAVIQDLLAQLQQAETQRKYWRSLIAQAVIQDPLLLSLVRLCGVRDLVAFAIGAIIGDIKRFAKPASLVNFIGLAPAFDDSGEGTWKGGVAQRGRKDLRSLLVEAAQSILRSSDPLAKWGRKLAATKSSMKVAVAAVARKLTVAIWYLMSGRWTAVEEMDKRLVYKVGKIVGEIGAKGLKEMGKSRKVVREEVFQSLKTGRVYLLDKDKKFIPKPKPAEAQVQPALS